MTAAIGAMWSAILRASSSTTRSASESPVRACANSVRVSSGAPRPWANSGQRLSARVDVLAQAHARVVELAGRSVVPPMELSVQHDPGAKTGADRDEREVVDAARDAAPPLAERGEVDVVLDPHRVAETRPDSRAESVLFEARDVRCEVDAARADVNCTRHTEHDAVECLLRRAGCQQKRSREGVDRLERGGGRRLGQLDVLACPDLTAHVADRTADEVHAQVEAEHERRLRHRFEERRAVARAVAGRLRLADETCVEQGLERL